LIASLLVQVAKLIGQVLNALGIAALAAVELFVKALQQIWTIGIKVSGVLLELMASLLIGVSKPFGSLFKGQGSGETYTSESALNWTGISMLVFFFASTISIVIPAEFTNPAWYARVIRAFVANGGLYIFGLLLLGLASSWPGSTKLLSKTTSPTVILGRLMAAIYAAVIPAFGYISFLGWNRLNTATNEQQVVIKQKRDQGLSEIAKATTAVPLRRVIQIAGSIQPPEAASLETIKQTASDVLIKAAILAGDQADKQKRQGQLATIIDLAKIFISTFSLSIASMALSNLANRRNH
jgi:hypothetical protein